MTGRICRTRRKSHSSEAGQAGAEILFFALILFTAMILVVVNAWATVDTKFMVTAAARQATRAYVEQSQAGAAAFAARKASDDVYMSYGANRQNELPIEINATFGRCERVSVRASYQIPALRLPFGVSIGTRVVASTHSELVDPFRSGIDSEVGGDCAA